MTYANRVRHRRSKRERLHAQSQHNAKIIVRQLIDRMADDMRDREHPDAIINTAVHHMLYGNVNRRGLAHVVVACHYLVQDIDPDAPKFDGTPDEVTKFDASDASLIDMAVRIARIGLVIAAKKAGIEWEEEENPNDLPVGNYL